MTLLIKEAKKIAMYHQSEPLATTANLKQVIKYKTNNTIDTTVIF